MRKARAWTLPLFCLAAWLGLRFSPLPDQALRQEHASAFLSSQGQLLRIRLSAGGKYRLPVKLQEMSPLLVKGFVEYEDRWFAWHPGVNPVSLLRAARLDLGAGKKLAGASTLDMQLAKLMRRRPRTLGAKLWEALRALQLEARYSKKEILELYLNSVPMGGNIEGVGAASYLYFGKPASQLSLGEAALLISLPRSPALRRPDVSMAAARQGRDRVLKSILPRLGVSAALAGQAYAALVPSRRFENPDAAPHFVRRAVQLGAGDAGVHVLTLDSNLQGYCAQQLGATHAELGRLGVANGALMVVDNRSMQVLAYLGSPDLREPEGGRINGAYIVRSPGSALKPLLYAMGLEAGLLTPKSMLFDLPRSYGGFRPANYEPGFAGPVRAEEALARSLNLPAVGLEADLGADGGLLGLLRRAGCTGRGRDQLDPGLAVALGAYPVSLEEIVRLYACLANGGLYRPLHFWPEDPAGAEPSQRLLTRQACYLVAQMLSQVQRPDLPSSWEFSPTRGRVAFKTGTSFGHRDAWCVGFNPEYTVGVWLGNARGGGRPVLAGAKTAAPLVISVFNLLTRHSDAWFERPPGLQRRRVCAVSGQAAGPDCPQTIEDDFIPGLSSTETCRVHRALWVGSKGLMTCPHAMTRPAGAYTRKVFEIWPPEVTRFFRSSGRHWQALPPLDPACLGFDPLPGPRIRNPRAGTVFWISQALPQGMQRLAFSAEAGPEGGALRWFLGPTQLETAKPDKPVFWPLRPGKFTVSVVDSQGRADRVDFVVRTPWERSQDQKGL